ncbi:hypothetical protein ACFVU0_13795 [Streptomyces sp. NPDC058122]|uniref:hypothetical protein n=1 Tax=Streptomyces sp. NPDC058122 TaxID=3346349 RepID=UPI0036EA545C
MADGTRKPIADVRVGDLIRATDPQNGRLYTQLVTDTMRHDTRRLVDITLTDG